MLLLSLSPASPYMPFKIPYCAFGQVGEKRLIVTPGSSISIFKSIFANASALLWSVSYLFTPIFSSIGAGSASSPT